jgi:hypothetical protein
MLRQATFARFATTPSGGWGRFGTTIDLGSPGTR